MKICQAKTELTCLHSCLATPYHGLDPSINCLHSPPIKPHGFLGFLLFFQRLCSCRDSYARARWTCRVLTNGRSPASPCETHDCLTGEVGFRFPLYDHQLLRLVLCLVLCVFLLQMLYARAFSRCSSEPLRLRVASLIIKGSCGFRSNILFSRTPSVTRPFMASCP